MALEARSIRILLIAATTSGIGKTVESGAHRPRNCWIVAKSRASRSSARLNWPSNGNESFATKFNIDAEYCGAPRHGNQPGARLPLGESLFEHHPFVIVSLDFIQIRPPAAMSFYEPVPSSSSSMRPTRARGAERGALPGISRHQLVSGLTTDPNRHIILVTAHPRTAVKRMHSGPC